MFTYLYLHIELHLHQNSTTIRPVPKYSPLQDIVFEHPADGFFSNNECDAGNHAYGSHTYGQGAYGS